jgi:hypothetical protein
MNPQGSNFYGGNNNPQGSHFYGGNYAQNTNQLYPNAYGGQNTMSQGILFC